MRLELHYNRQAEKIAAMTLSDSIWASEAHGETLRAVSAAHQSRTSLRASAAFGNPATARGSAITDITNMARSTPQAHGGPLLFNPDLLAEAKALNASFKTSGGAKAEHKRGASPRVSPMTRPMPPRRPSPLNYGENRAPVSRPAPVPSRPAAAPVARAPYVEPRFGPPPPPPPRDQAYKTTPAPKVVVEVPVQTAKPPPAAPGVSTPVQATAQATAQDDVFRSVMEKFKALGKTQNTGSKSTVASTTPLATPKVAAASASVIDHDDEAAKATEDAAEIEKRRDRAIAAQAQLDQSSEDEKLYAESRAAKVTLAKAAASVASSTIPPHLRDKAAVSSDATTSAAPLAASLAIPSNNTPSPAAYQATVEDELEWADEMEVRRAKEAEELKFKQTKEAEALKAKQAKEAEKLKMKLNEAKEAEENRLKEAKAKEAAQTAAKEAKAEEARAAAATAAAAAAKHEVVKPVAGTWETGNATVTATFTPLDAEHNDLAAKTKEILNQQMKAVVAAEHRGEATADDVVLRLKEKGVRFNNTPQVFAEPEKNGESSKKRKVEQRTVSTDTDTWGSVNSETDTPANETTGLSEAEIQSKVMGLMIDRGRIQRVRKQAEEALEKADAELQIIDENVDILLKTLKQV